MAITHRSIANKIRRELRSETTRMTYGEYEGQIIARIVWNAEKRLYLESLCKLLEQRDDVLSSLYSVIKKCLWLQSAWMTYKHLKDKERHEFLKQFPTYGRISSKNKQQQQQKIKDDKITSLVNEISMQYKT